MPWCQAVRLAQVEGGTVVMDQTNIGIRGICADLTAAPYLSQKMNGSLFCLGARALGGWGGDDLGIGVPYTEFKAVISGMQASAKGFPYGAYPA